MPYHRCRRWPSYWCMYAIVHEEETPCIDPELFRDLRVLGVWVVLKDLKVWLLDFEEEMDEETLKKVEVVVKEHGLKVEEYQCKKIEEDKK